MTYLEALYGSQYSEISLKGGKTESGRLNGNLFLSAFIVILFFLTFTIIFSLSESLELAVNHFLSSIFGNSTGKNIGKIIAIPLFVLIILIVSKTIGSKKNYHKLTTAFMKYDEVEKQKANKKILKPFLIALALLLIFSLKGLF